MLSKLLPFVVAASCALSAAAQAVPATQSTPARDGVARLQLVDMRDRDRDRDRDERRERRDRAERCERVKHDCAEDFKRSTWRFNRCVRTHDCG
jgi:Ni/Co efflux regulator RcnB